jgi:hypothetical protein
MSSGKGTGIEGAAAGHGRLAQVIATRGGLAAPEAPFVIEHREALIYMLCEAAELEHTIMCQYLFAAFSLKQSADEGLTEEELAAVTRWRRQVSHVAAQEMLHLALVQNMLTAIGAAPHLARPNLPAPASHYPAGCSWRCCRSASRRCGTSCSWSVRRAWTWPTRTGWRRWAARSRR